MPSRFLNRRAVLRSLAGTSLLLPGILSQLLAAEDGTPRSEVDPFRTKGVGVILVIDVRLIFYCLDDLSRRPIVTLFDKQTWAVVIIVGGPLGQIAYWLYGRAPG